MTAANAIGWRVTHLYAFCPEHKHRYRDDAQRRMRGKRERQAAQHAALRT